MKAIILNQNSYELQIGELEKPKASKDKVLIQLKACALNHQQKLRSALLFLQIQADTLNLRDNILPFHSPFLQSF